MPIDPSAPSRPPRRIRPALAVLGVLLLAGCATRTVTVVQTVTVAPPADAGAASATDGSDPGGLGGDAGPTTAAGHGGTSSDRYATLDPCTLVTQAEAEKISGVAMLAGDSDPGQDCSYGTDPNAGATSQVDVYIGDGAKHTYDLDRSLGHTFTAVPGIGDEAWSETSTVFARHGKLWVQVGDPLLDGTPDDQARLVAALTTAVSRLH